MRTFLRSLLVFLLATCAGASQAPLSELAIWSSATSPALTLRTLRLATQERLAVAHEAQSASAALAAVVATLRSAPPADAAGTAIEEYARLAMIGNRVGPWFDDLRNPQDFAAWRSELADCFELGLAGLVSSQLPMPDNALLAPSATSTPAEARRQRTDIEAEFRRWGLIDNQLVLLRGQYERFLRVQLPRVPIDPADARRRIAATGLSATAAASLKRALGLD